jgi:CheY-like chemotaxis protein
MESHLNLLVVDDNPIDLVVFSRAANRTGLNMRVQTLTAGQGAIDYLNAKGEYTDRGKFPWPDVIVLDLKMPELNGFDFLAWRKASALFLSIPVIILSGSNEPDDLKRIFELGANKHFVKPSELHDWEGIVRDIWDFATSGTAFLNRTAMPPQIEPKAVA